ncbi:MAG TPA: hypothetical protein VGM30_19760 [Puia sp.]|jgi:hypothetical protein
MIRNFFATNKKTPGKIPLFYPFRLAMEKMDVLTVAVSEYNYKKSSPALVFATSL